MKRLLLFLSCGAALGFCAGCSTSTSATVAGSESRYASADYSATLLLTPPFDNVRASSLFWSADMLEEPTFYVTMADGRVRDHRKPTKSLNFVPGYHEVAVTAMRRELFTAKTTLQLEVEAGHTYRLLTEEDGAGVTFIVRDETPGVVAEDRDRIFAATDYQPNSRVPAMIRQDSP